MSSWEKFGSSNHGDVDSEFDVDFDGNFNDSYELPSDSDIAALLNSTDSPPLSIRDSTSFDFSNIHSIPLSLSLSRSELDLPRTVTLWSGVSLIVGMCIGSGIFASPGPILGFSKSVGMSLFVWVLAGFLALTGSLCYAELGSMIQTSGGEHAYLMKAFGSLPAFLFSWTGILVTRPGSVAIITVTFSEYVVRLIYFDHPHGTAPEIFAKIIAIICVLLLTVINCMSTRLGTLIQDVFTVLKILALLVIGIIGIYILGGGRSTSHNFDNLFAGSSKNPGDYALALYSALWAYDGWNSLNLVTGELKDPSKNIPRAVIFGPIIVMICYVLANIAYYAVLPSDIVMHSSTIAVDFGKTVFGPIGGVIIPFIVIGSTFGAANATIFTGARVISISSKAGHAPKFLSRVHPELHTPIAALALQCILSCIFISFGSFTTLVNFFSMIAWTFYLLAVLALLSLRWNHPALERPFKVHLMFPVVFVFVTVFLITFSLMEAPWEGAGAIIFFSSGVPVWWLGRNGVTMDHVTTFLSVLFAPIILVLYPLISQIPIPRFVSNILSPSHLSNPSRWSWQKTLETVQNIWKNIYANTIGLVSGVKQRYHGTGHGYTKQATSDNLELDEGLQGESG
ncbi:Large neutral amino acids transporter small subunit 1 [Nowakowskiella sp. JEL0078]|nr:Large neutral amino acids transporter small subunit 1 [Nowakowskiella sp. JEL0078]